MCRESITTVFNPLVILAVGLVVATSPVSAQSLSFEADVGPEWAEAEKLAKDDAGRIYALTWRKGISYRTGSMDRWGSLDFGPNEAGGVLALEAFGDGWVMWSDHDGVDVRHFRSGDNRDHFVNQAVNDISIANSGDIYLGAETGVYYSSDSARTWDKITTPASPVNNITTHTDSILSVSSADTVWVSYNHGQDWTEYMVTPYRSPKDMLFVGDSTLLVAANGIHRIDHHEDRFVIHEYIDSVSTLELTRTKNGKILAGAEGTGDGLWTPYKNAGIYIGNEEGTSWEQKKLPYSRVNDLLVGEDGQFFAATEDFFISKYAMSTPSWGIVRLDESWEQWTPINQGLSEANVRHFSVSDEGYWLASVIGIGVFRSADEGDNWDRLSVVNKDSIVKLGYLHNYPINYVESFGKLAFVAMRDSTIFRSADKANTWDTLAAKIGVQKMERVDDSVFMAVGNGNLYRSSDKGMTWDSVSHDFTDIVNDPTTNAVFGLRNDKVYKSPDRGKTWSTVIFEKQVSRLKMNSKGDLLVYGGNRAFVKEQGVTVWDSIPTPHENEYSSVSYALTAGDTLYTTYNGDIFWSADWGQQWHQMNLFTHGSGELQIGGDNHLYLLSAGVYRSNRRVTTHSPSRNEVPKQTTLKQNYPNPFNPATTISYTLPRTANVRLTVFDVLGQKVATVVDAKRRAGQHSVTFDAGNLSSGVYIYQIKTNEFIESRKMLLVK